MHDDIKTPKIGGTS
jgi:hypothetical protein